MNAQINPVDFMIQKSGISRAEFAAKYGFGRNFLTRTVQGRARGVTDRLSAALWKEWSVKGINQDEFDSVYGVLDTDLAFQRWVTNRRITNKVKLPASVPHDKNLTPFMRLVRSIGSVSKTAQTLVVADVAVQRYADGRQKQMPDSIKTALSEMQYPHVAELDSAQQNWHKNRA